MLTSSKFGVPYKIGKVKIKIYSKENAMCGRKPWIWNEYTIRCNNASLLSSTLPEVLRGKTAHENTLLVVRVPPEEDTPQHEAFVLWTKKQNIVLSALTGSVRETTPMTA